MKRNQKRAGRPSGEAKSLYNVRVPKKLVASIKKFCAGKGWSQATFAEKAFNYFIATQP